jgi:hypothetical protein
MIIVERAVHRVAYVLAVGVLASLLVTAAYGHVGGAWRWVLFAVAYLSIRFLVPEPKRTRSDGSIR